MWQDLTQPFHGDMPFASSLSAPTFETVQRVEEDGINVQHYCVPTHVGTHVDAPRHFIEGAETIDELPLDRFAGDGVVLDVSAPEPVEIGVEDVEAADVTVEEDDIVLLYTGWDEKYGTDAYDPHPWVSEELAEWFVDRGVNLVGVDNITPDIPGPMRPDDWMEFPIHKILLGNDVLIAEHLGNLASLADERVEVVGFPMKIRGGDGAPARFVARR